MRVNGDVDSADASTAAEIVMRDQDGNTVTVAATHRLVIYSMTISCLTAAASPITVFEDPDGGNDVDAGDAIVTARFPVEHGVAHFVFPQGRWCRIGAAPHIISAAAGAVDVQFQGEIRHPGTF